MELLGCATPEGLVLVKCTFAFTLHWKEQNFDADHVLDGLNFFYSIHLIRHGGSLRWTRLRRGTLTKLDLDAGHVLVGLEIRT